MVRKEGYYKEYYAKNADRIRAYMREYYAKKKAEKGEIVVDNS